MTIEIPKTNRILDVPAVSSSYPTLGNAYKHDGYEVKSTSSKHLVRTPNMNYYQIKEQLPAGYKMSTAGEERAIQRDSESKKLDPRKSKAFDDLFARNKDKTYVWQWTETGLRVPEGRKADVYETDVQGRKYWPRIVLLGDKEIGEVLVPEGSARLVAEWDEVFGVPRVTIENTDWPHKPYTTHFWFNATPNKDSTSDHYDVAVGRGGDWHHAVDERCLDVDAAYRRLLAYSDDGFRPVVRGDLPEIDKELARINPKKIEQALIERMKIDIGQMSITEFLKKYNLQL